jgi:hypothetical protein
VVLWVGQYRTTPTRRSFVCISGGSGSAPTRTGGPVFAQSAFCRNTVNYVRSAAVAAPLICARINARRSLSPTPCGS